MVIDEINTDWSLFSIIWQIFSVPSSTWYLLKRALVSMKKGTDYRFSLSSITLLEREIPISERLFWTSLSEILIFGSSFKCLWIFELILGLHSVSVAIFDIVKPPSHLLVFSLTNREKFIQSGQSFIYNNEL